MHLVRSKAEQTDGIMEIVEAVDLRYIVSVCISEHSGITFVSRHVHGQASRDGVVLEHLMKS